MAESASVRRVLVSGGGGFIAANLVRALRSIGHRVDVLVRPGSRDWRLADVAEELRFHEADLRDLDRLRAVVRAARPEWVFHLAASGGYPHQTDEDEIVSTNLLGTVNLATVCLECDFEAFIHAGTSLEYGRKDHAPSEEEVPTPAGAYAVTKASATMLCSSLAREHSRPMPTMRLYSVFGPWEEPSRLVPSLLVHAARRTLPPLARPEVQRDFIYVADVVAAMIRLAERAGELDDPGCVLNVGTGTALTLAEVVEAVRGEFGLRCEPRWSTMPDRVWDTETWVSDPHRIQALLQWRPDHDFRSGLRATAEWYDAHEELHARYDGAFARGGPLL